jgi:hypothetical protein
VAVGGRRSRRGGRLAAAGGRQERRVGRLAAAGGPRAAADAPPAAADGHQAAADDPAPARSAPPAGAGGPRAAADAPPAAADGHRAAADDPAPARCRAGRPPRRALRDAPDPCPAARVGPARCRTGRRRARYGPARCRTGLTAPGPNRTGRSAPGLRRAGPSGPGHHGPDPMRLAGWRDPAGCVPRPGPSGAGRPATGGRRRRTSAACRPRPATPSRNGFWPPPPWRTAWQAGPWTGPQALWRSHTPEGCSTSSHFLVITRAGRRLARRPAPQFGSQFLDSGIGGRRIGHLQGPHDAASPDRLVQTDRPPAEVGPSAGRLARRIVGDRPVR